MFDPFCLDLSNQCLWRGSQPIKLRPKAFAVLAYLLAHAAQPATKDELLNAVCPKMHAISATCGKAVVETEPPAIIKSESWFNQAIRIAQQQSAKSLELRDVMSITHLYQKQGKQGRARHLLVQIYGRFTEAFNTLDQREAKALLDSLP